MINWKNVISMLAALALLFTVSCKRDEPQTAVPGRITLTIATGETVTKAVSGNPADGGGISVDGDGKPDIIILIANNSKNIVAWYPEDFKGSMPTGYTSSCLDALAASTPVSESTIYFTGPTRGNYTVFAIANTSGLSADIRTAIAGASNLDQLEALYLTAIPSGGVMPISAKGPLSVNSSGNGQIDLELLRMFSKICITFNNQTGSSIDVHACSVTIYGINPSRGYLFPMDTDYYSNYDADLVINDCPNPLVFTDKKCVLPEKNVFPSVAPTQLVGSRYLCDISFDITKTDKDYDPVDGTTFDHYDFPSLPIHDSRSSDIPYLKRNQHLKIETRINKRVDEHDISFNFEVSSWEDEEAFVAFH